MMTVRKIAAAAAACGVALASPVLAQVDLDMSYTANAGSIARTNVSNKMVEKRTRQYQRRSPARTASIARARCADAARAAADGAGDPALLRLCARAGYR
jgi:hypothetical protein